jgi:nucleotide-binding universal stress UspA family protein
VNRAGSGRARIVVGVDGSECSLDALRQGISIARSRDGIVEAVTVWHFPYTSYSPLPPLLWEPEKDAQTALENSLDEVLGDERPEWLVARTVEGTPSRALIRESKGADMLIVGSRGRGGFSGLLLGSVSSACATHAACPVLVVHQAQREDQVAPHAAAEATSR